MTWLQNDIELVGQVHDLMGDWLWKAFAHVGGWDGRSFDMDEYVKHLCRDYGSGRLGFTWAEEGTDEAYAEMVIMASQALLEQ